LDFSIGRISTAIFQSIELVQQNFPNIFFKVYWTEDDPHPTTAITAEPPATNRIDLRYLAPLPDPPSRDVHMVATDTLVLARLKVPSNPELSAARSPGSQIVVPRIPRPLQLRLEQFLRGQKAIESADLVFTSENSGSILKLLADRPEASFLVPSFAVSHLAALSNLSIDDFGENLDVPIVALIDGEDAAARSFVGHLRTLLSQDGVDRPFEPRLTLRQLNYFTLLRQAGSVTRAAKLAAVAQPAVTEQLNKLETVVGRLFVRHRHGLELTAEGRRFAQASQLLLALLDELKLKRPRAVLLTGGRVELGILPSVGPDGYLLSRITRAVEIWRARHPAMHLRILEEPNFILQERISQGTLDLGIVTTRSPRMARFDLGSSEELALIANSRQNVLPEKGAVHIAQLANLPLVLPSTDFGIRQRIDAACHQHGIVVTPVIEVDSLSMCVALIRESALCTILPPSELTREIQSGELVYRYLSPKLVRTVQIIYSAKRALTQAERDLVELLRIELQMKDRPHP
jgi:DNA-binding transcriptional LysR family regulator